MVGLDVESMVKNGVVETCYQKARLAEILIRDHFKNPSIDLAGGNKNSHCDGICPGDKTYDVKSSKFFKYEGRHIFNFKNVYKDKIELLYLLGFNDKYTELMYSWRVPAWKFIDTDTFAINALNGDFTIDNMKEYLITEEIKDVFNKYGYFEKIRNYKITRVKGHEIYK